MIIGLYGKPYLIFAYGRSLPFADRLREQTVAIASLCYIDDWPRAVGKIVRVTRARFAMGLLNRHSPLWRRTGRDRGTGGYAGLTGTLAGNSLRYLLV
jgi:hypothetical protein